MFKTALNKNIIPHTWKLANIVPIPKPNKDTDKGTSYRPISLLSVIAKTLEKSLLPYITANILNTPMQHWYKTPHSDIINPSENVLDLGITMSRNCPFDVYLNILCKKCTDLSGWILRTFTSRDSTTLMTLFNALILSRLDYCSQLWSPHLIRHIIPIEKFNVPLLNSWGINL